MAAENVALTLGNLAHTVEHRKPIVDEGAIPLLVPLLRASAKSKAPENAALALANLVVTVDNRKPIVDAGAIPLLVPLLQADAESELAENAALALANLVGGNTELIFDGGSFLVQPSGGIQRLPAFSPESRFYR